MGFEMEHRLDVFQAMVDGIIGSCPDALKVPGFVWVTGPFDFVFQEQAGFLVPD